MMEYLSDLRLFCEIANTLNFRQAGEQLGYSPAVVSMRVKRLETITGKTLFLRSTRHISITEEGRELLVLAQKTLDLTELMTLDRQRLNGGRISGQVRIAAPHSFARVFLLQPIRQLHVQNPGLTIELLLDDQFTPLVREGIDLSFRVGEVRENNVESENLIEDKRILIASPDYLTQYGEPRRPADLKQHLILSHLHMKHWELTGNGETVRVPLKRVMFCNTGDYLTWLAVDGAGITMKSDWSVRDYIERGQLQHVLPDYTLGEQRFVRVVTPRREVTPLRVRHVLEVIREHL
ncbi:DNA-binding transcriptional LysR family regulator [Oceanisphaera litoralis]|uniref:LysR family transcriptional regulator n=1 Tax=Oceanisphaera litoralis TaxID=225144 RepID=UPI00195991BB|nr:LysR family transcriptional regulator [Oceanisphaera litoralis]MBM7455879.1 DNA-binding transcriptional LysR family regulator [Oceanisphaera litoralis]